MGGGRRTKWGFAIAALVVLVAFLAFGPAYLRHPNEVSLQAPSSPLPPPRVHEQRSDVRPRAVLGAESDDGPSKTDSPIEVDVCGKGKVPSEGDHWTNIYQYVLAVTQDATARWRTGLLDSSDNRARVVGLMLQSAEFRGADSAVEAEESKREMIQLAARTGDPAVYALAVTVCRGIFAGLSQPLDACQQISLFEWTRLDPDNAQPWIATAQAARNLGDVPAEASAFARAAASHEIRSPSEALVSVGLAMIPQDATPLERAAMAIDLVGYGSAFAQPLAQISRYCSADGIKQYEVQKECSAIAELLVDHGDSVIDFNFGRKLGERVGWPLERTRPVPAESAAPPGLSITDLLNPWSCQSASRINTYMEKRAKLGEIGMLKEQIERSSRRSAQSPDP
jgi:hypothetical protein